MQQFYVWDDEYDDILQNEIQKKKGNIHILTKQDWKYILQNKSIDLYKKKDLSFSILTTSKLTKNDYVQLLHLFAGLQPEILANPQEPSAELIEQINRDVGRTFKQWDFFKELKNQNRLRQLLLNYADYDPEVGYAQGMNFIAACLIYNNVEEEFLLFKEIIRTLRSNYMAGTPGLFQSLARLQFKIKDQLPKLNEHFKLIGLKDISVSFSHHYLTLLLQNCPQKYQLIILSMFILEGEKIIHKLLIGMLRLSQHMLLNINDVQLVSKFIRFDMVEYFFNFLQSSRKEWQLLKVLFELRLIKKQ